MLSHAAVAVFPLVITNSRLWELLALLTAAAEHAAR